jgi:hypothetical protein
MRAHSRNPRRRQLVGTHRRNVETPLLSLRSTVAITQSRNPEPSRKPEQLRNLEPNFVRTVLLVPLVRARLVAVHVLRDHETPG